METPMSCQQTKMSFKRFALQTSDQTLCSNKLHYPETLKKKNNLKLMKTLSLFSQAWSNTQILIIKKPDCFFCYEIPC